MANIGRNGQEGQPRGLAKLGIHLPLRLRRFAQRVEQEAGPALRDAAGKVGRAADQVKHTAKEVGQAARRAGEAAEQVAHTAIDGVAGLAEGFENADQERQDHASAVKQAAMLEAVRLSGIVMQGSNTRKALGEYGSEYNHNLVFQALLRRRMLDNMIAHPFFAGIELGKRTSQKVVPSTPPQEMVPQDSPSPARESGRELAYRGQRMYDDLVAVVGQGAIADGLTAARDQFRIEARGLIMHAVQEAETGNVKKSPDTVRQEIRQLNLAAEQIAHHLFNEFGRISSNRQIDKRAGNALKNARKQKNLTPIEL